MGKKHEETKELVYRAIDELKRGDRDAAMSILERTARPKWWSINRCNEAFALKDQPHQSSWGNPG
jgi:hypothetical protein